MVKHHHLLTKFSKRVLATKKMNTLKEMGIADVNEFTNELAINTDRFEDQKVAETKFHYILEYFFIYFYLVPLENNHSCK